MAARARGASLTLLLMLGMGCSSSSGQQQPPAPTTSKAPEAAKAGAPERQRSTATSGSTSTSPAAGPIVDRPAASAAPPGIVAGPRPTLGGAPHRVVIFTLDGVRPVDLARATSGNEPLMPTLTALMPSSLVVGLDEDKPGATTPAMVPLSLPGYRALMEGHLSECLDNRCSRTTEETLLERVAAVYSQQGVAVFASWAGVRRAATHEDGDDPLVDAPWMGAEATAARPWPDGRLDAKTMATALTHLRAAWPPLLWIALLDTDEWAHRADRAKTDAALAAADRQLGELLQVLKDAPAAHRRPTTVLITTDHGRGPGDGWPHHKARDGSEKIFIIANGPGVKAATSSSLGELSLSDVRPTVERLLGVCSARCMAEQCGRVIPEVLGARARIDGPCRKPGGQPMRVPTLK